MGKRRYLAMQHSIFEILRKIKKERILDESRQKIKKTH